MGWTSPGWQPSSTRGSPSGSEHRTARASQPVDGCYLGSEFASADVPCSSGECGTLIPASRRWRARPPGRCMRGAGKAAVRERGTGDGEVECRRGKCRHSAGDGSDRSAASRPSSAARFLGSRHFSRRQVPRDARCGSSPGAAGLGMGGVAPIKFDGGISVQTAIWPLQRQVSFNDLWRSYKVVERARRQGGSIAVIEAIGGNVEKNGRRIAGKRLLMCVARR